MKGGGVEKSLLFRTLMGRTHFKRLYQEYIAADAEGYVGLSRHTNRMMKRTRAYGQKRFTKIKY